MKFDNPATTSTHGLGATQGKFSGENSEQARIFTPKASPRAWESANPQKSAARPA